jgi:Skp family chaperone for outer membrane proteins
MIRALNAKCLENNEDILVDEEKFFEQAHVFDTVDNQQSFVNEFLENKGIAKEMRGHVADKKKAAKEAEKEAAKAKKVAEKEAAKDAKKAEKEAAKEAAKKEKGANKGKKAPKKTAPKKVVEAEPDLVTSLVTMATSEEVPLQEEEEPELDVRTFKHDGVEYLIDDNNNLYDTNTHETVGSFNVESRKIIRV